MRRWWGFALGVLVGFTAASGLAYVGVRHILLVGVNAPVLAFHAADPGYTVRGEQSLVFSEPFGWMLGDSATWTHEVPVPLLEPRRRVAFDARLGDRPPMRVFVDTAAQANFMSWDGLAALGVPERIPASSSLVKHRAVGATGTYAPRYLVVEALTFGPHTLRDQPFSLIPMPLAALGLPTLALGSHAFAGVTLDIDLAARLLRVNPDAPLAPATPWLPGTVLPRVRGTVQGVDVVVQIDTGATTTAISPALRERLALAPLVTDDHVTGASGDRVAVTGAELPPLDVAGAILPAGPVHVMVVDSLAPAVPDGLYVNLGMDALDGHRVVIDYPARTLAIASPTGTSE